MYVYNWQFDIRIRREESLMTCVQADEGREEGYGAGG